MASYFLPNESRWKVFLLWRSVNPDWLSLAVRTTVISIFVLAISWFYSDPEATFFILAAILFMFTAPTETKRMQLRCQILTGLLSTLGVFVVSWASPSLWSLIPVLSICAFIAIFAGNWGLGTYGTSGLLSVLMMVTAAGMPVTSVKEAGLRAFMCVLALGLALPMNLIFLGRKPERRLRRALVDLSAIAADFFCHAAYDSVRGNYIHARHWQLKEKLLLQMDKSDRYFLACSLKKKSLKYQQEYEYLQNIYGEFRKWLELMFTISNVLTNPANNRVLISIVPEVTSIRVVVLQFLENFKQNMVQPEANIVFSRNAYIEIQKKIYEISNKSLNSPNLFNWPFDLNSLCVLLGQLQAITDQMIDLLEL